MGKNNPCKEIINLAGSLDWRFRNGRSPDEIKSVIKQMRRKLTEVENLIKENEK
jgi:hypothetical protein